MGGVAMADIDLRADQSYRAAGRAVLAVRTRELFARADNVLDMEDPERVHRMRVATRRLRAALEVFRPCFPRKRASAVLSEVKALAGALGERRDCDVLIELLDSLRADAGRSERKAIDVLIAELRDEQIAANTRLAEALGRVAQVGLERELLRLTR
jgi:CHAD domain-containing protein